MPEDNTNKNRQGPVKVALTVGLTILFLAIVIVQIRTYSGDGAMAAEEAVSSNSTVLDPRTNPRPDHGDNGRIVPWPAVDLAECTAHDPFATPDGFILKKEVPAEQAASQDMQDRETALARQKAIQKQAIAQLMEAGATAIIKSPDQTMAVVGTDTVRVGQEIHGYRVVAIEMDGIVLEPITTDSTSEPLTSKIVKFFTTSRNQFKQAISTEQ